MGHARSSSASSSAQMPPWGIDPHVGIQSFKNDPSLREDEIEKIAKWVDAGAPMGNAADMPKPREFDDSDRWHIGKPDLDRHLAAAQGARRSRPTGGAATTSTPASPRIATSRRSRASPGKTAVVHHLLTYAVDADASGDSNGDDSSGDAGEFLNEFAVGKNGDLFPEGTGRLLRAGSKIKFDFHYHSVGQEITDQSQLGIVLYPKGYVPKHIVYSKQLGQPTEPLDIPGGSTYVRSDGYTRFNKAGPHHRVPAAHAHARQAAVHRADLSGQQDRADQLRRLELQLAPRQRLCRRCGADLSGGHGAARDHAGTTTRRPRAIPIRGTGSAAATGRSTRWASPGSPGTTTPTTSTRRSSTRAKA